MDKIRTTAFVFMGLGLIPLGGLIVRSGAVSRWVGWLVLVGGSLGFVGMFAKLVNVDFAPLRIVALALFIPMLVLGIRLLARKTRDPTE